MLFGAAGQTLTMVLLAILGAVDTSAAQVVSAVLLFVFNSFFAVGWLGMTWLYVRVRCIRARVSIGADDVIAARGDCWTTHPRTRQCILDC